MTADPQAGIGADAIAPAHSAEPGLRTKIEAILLVVDEPVDVTTLAQAVEHPVPDVENVLAALAREYDEAERGFTLRCVAGGWRLYTRPEAGPWVERFVQDGQVSKLSQAALETLAVVAYRQPVTRSRIAAIRGVNVDAVMRTLTTRGLVSEAGAEPGTGASLYVTTSLFLERMGLRSLEDLPEVAEGVPDPDDLDTDDLAGG